MEDEDFINELLDSFGGQTEEEEVPNINDLNTFITPQDVKTGDVLIFTNAGEFVEMDYSLAKDGSDISTVLQIEVELPNGKKKLISPNKTSRNEISTLYGVNTEDWVNKSVEVELVKQNVMGKLRDVIYLKPIKE